MLKIGEFAALSGISIVMLRNYDKSGLLVPAFVEQESGYRYYDKSQLIWANRIVAMKAMGFGLEEIKKSLELSAKEQEAVFIRKMQEKEEELKILETQINKIKETLKLEEYEKELVLHVVKKQMPAMYVVSCRGIIHSFPEEGRLWETLMKYCIEAEIYVPEDASAMAVQYGMDEERKNIDVEVMLSVPKFCQVPEPFNSSKIPEREVVSIVFEGSYSQIGRINTFLARWLEKNRYEICGKPFSIYHKSPRESREEKSFLTELCFPVKKNEKGD